ncbi:DUF1446 domain-containing protein [Williamsia muralis]|uniref:acyclic terpene utilization AtuA family protein n=1 Tax=Williamsia marianensis TaxID=85044 RepID=UPI003F1741CD
MAVPPIRIANFSGYLGDRYTALDEVMRGDPVDVLMGDYLAEITLAALAARYARDASKGYVEYFVDQVRPHLPALADRGLRVVTNAGGFNPAALAAALRSEITTLGLSLRVAHVEGDNVFAELDNLQRAGHRLENMDTGRDLSEWGVTPIAANAYLGGWGIAAALDAGADIVVCGRVTDASLTVGPAAWWHGWATDDWDRLAGAVMAGHIIECGPHATGGNFSGFTALRPTLTPGFPIAEIEADGSSVITKHSTDDGVVTADTVTAQIVYEIQGPQYLNPDVTVDLHNVRLQPEGTDRIRVTGVTGSPPPATTKVAVFGLVGYSVVNTVFVTAPDVDEKVSLLRSQIDRDMPEGVEVHCTRIGTAATDPHTQWDATIAVRVMAMSADADVLASADMARRLGALYLQGIPGFFHDGAAGLHSTPKPRVDYWPALLPLAAIDHRAVLDDVTVDIAPSAVTQTTGQPEHPEPADPEYAGATTTVELGVVAHARSGDKGGNSNVGIWTPYPKVWPWLRRFLSTEELHRLMPETKDLDIVRHEFPELRAVHFVVRGLLGTGGSSNVRVDQVGKAVGEYLRAKHVVIPDAVLDQVRKQS